MQTEITRFLRLGHVTADRTRMNIEYETLIFSPIPAKRYAQAWPERSGSGIQNVGG